jgi:hypothetical protein
MATASVAMLFLRPKQINQSDDSVGHLRYRPATWPDREVEDECVECREKSSGSEGGFWSL